MHLQDRQAAFVRPQLGPSPMQTRSLPLCILQAIKAQHSFACEAPTGPVVQCHLSSLNRSCYLNHSLPIKQADLEPSRLPKLLA